MNAMKSILRFWIVRMLVKFCDEKLSEGIVGDLQEIYDFELEQYGSKQAKTKLFFRSLGFFRQTFKQRRAMYKSRLEALLRNYVKMAFRQGQRNYTTALVNLSGLTFGLSACFFLAQYVYVEWSHDRHFSEHDQVYRLALDLHFGDDLTSIAVSPSGFGKAAVNELKSVSEYAMLRRYTVFKFGTADNLVPSEHIYEVNDTFDQVLQFHWISGDPTTALTEPNSIVLTERYASAIFGDNLSISGSQIMRENGDLYTVTGIVKTPPTTSHIHPDAFISLRDPDMVNKMDIWRYYTYVRLNDHANLESLKEELQDFSEKIFGDKGGSGRATIDIVPQRLTDIHFTSKREFELEPNDGNLAYLKGFLVLIIVLLFMSVVNFISLTTAQIGQRIKEIAVKKTFGAFRKDLMLQFLVESSLYVFISFIFAITIVLVFQGKFESFSGIQFPFEEFLISSIFSSSVLVFVVLVLMVGLFPAIYFSQLNGGKLIEKGMMRFRSAMLFIQLSISVIVLICTQAFYTQITYMSAKDLGYETEQILLVKLSNEEERSVLPLVDQLESLASVESVSASYHFPGSKPPVNDFEYATETGDQELVCQHIHVDADYLKTLNFTLKSGRFFQQERGFSEPESGVLVNEAFVRKVGWKQGDVLGQKLTSGAEWEGAVIGVIKDFHFSSLHDEIAPMVIRHTPAAHNIGIKLNTVNYQQVMSELSAVWKKTYGHDEINVTFLDQHFQAQYEKDQKRASLFLGFSVLVVLIAFSGLLGMVTYAVNRRAKEMSIRKVHGANKLQILVLMCKEYGIISFLAAIGGSLVAYYLLLNWLQNFAYKIDVSGKIIFIPVCLVLLSVVAVSALKSAHLAKTNPSEVLRSE